MHFALQVSEFCNQFYRTYFLTIEQEIFAVLTDTFHKPGFKLHVLVLQHLFCLVTSLKFISSCTIVPHLYQRVGSTLREESGFYLFILIPVVKFLFLSKHGNNFLNNCR